MTEDEPLTPDQEADLIIEKLKRAGDKIYKYDPESIQVDFYFTPVQPVKFIYVNMVINGQEVTFDKGSGS